MAFTCTCSIQRFVLSCFQERGVTWRWNSNLTFDWIVRRRTQAKKGSWVLKKNRHETCRFQSIERYGPMQDSNSSCLEWDTKPRPKEQGVALLHFHCALGLGVPLGPIFDPPRGEAQSIGDGKKTKRNGSVLMENGVWGFQPLKLVTKKAKRRRSPPDRRRNFWDTNKIASSQVPGVSDLGKNRHQTCLENFDVVRRRCMHDFRHLPSSPQPPRCATKSTHTSFS